jgi:hypothetical protein
MKGIDISQPISLSKFNSNISEISLKGYLGLFKELMHGMGWQDMTNEVYRLDSQQHSQMIAFKTRFEAYIADESLENVRNLLNSIDEQLPRLRYQRSHLLRLQRRYAQEEMDKDHQNSSSVFSRFFYQGVERLRYFFDSTSDQLAKRYQQSADQHQQWIKNLSILKNKLHNEMRHLLTVSKDEEISSDYSILEFQASTQSSCAKQRQILGSYNPLEDIDSVFSGAMEFQSLASGAYNPFVRTLYDGSFIVTWNTAASSESNSIISAAYIKNDKNIEYPFNVSDSLTNQSNPTVAIFDNLQSIFTWDSGNAGNKSIYVSCYSADYSEDMVPGVPFMVNGISSGNNAYPVVATFQNFFVIAWAFNSTSSQPAMYAKFYQASINYVDNSILCNNSMAITGEIPLSTTQDYMSNVSVDVTTVKDSQTNQGQYYFTWASREGDVYVRPFSIQGVPLRSEIKLDNVYKVPPKSKPLIEAKSDGNLLVAWRENFFTDADIYAQVVSTQGSGKNFGFPMQPSFDIVNSYADENYPAIGTFPGGNFVAVWSISLNSNNSQDCINFEKEFCPTGLYARFFAADETPIKNWFCIINNQSFTNRVVDSNIDTFGNGNFVLVATDDQSLLSYGIYQNQPPQWITPALLIEDEYTNDMLSLPLSNNLKSYDASGYIKDPEGGTVTCTGGINTSSVSGRGLMPLVSKNLVLDESTCLLSSSKLLKGSTMLNLQAYDPEQSETKPDLSLVLNVNNRLSPGEIAAIVVCSFLGLLSAIGFGYYKYNKYRQTKENEHKARENENYRLIQSPFTNEVHAWLNLEYEKFESGDGEKFYTLINMVLQEIRNHDEIPRIDRYGSPNPLADEKPDVTLDDLFHQNRHNAYKVRFCLYALAVAKSIYLNTTLLPKKVEGCSNVLILPKSTPIPQPGQPGTLYLQKTEDDKVEVYMTGEEKSKILPAHSFQTLVDEGKLNFPEEKQLPAIDEESPAPITDKGLITQLTSICGYSSTQAQPENRSKCCTPKKSTFPLDKISLNLKSDAKLIAVDIVADIVRDIEPGREEAKQGVKWKLDYLNGHRSPWIRECQSSLINNSYEKFRNQERSSLRKTYSENKPVPENKSDWYSLFHLGGRKENSAPESVEMPSSNL